jgi:hypothetical protein
MSSTPRGEEVESGGVGLRATTSTKKQGGEFGEGTRGKVKNDKARAYAMDRLGKNWLARDAQGSIPSPK